MIHASIYLTAWASSVVTAALGVMPVSFTMAAVAALAMLHKITRG